jgi:hypothetical protein
MGGVAMKGAHMMLTREKVVDKVAKSKLEGFLDNMFEEAMQMQDEDKEILLMSACFVGYESLSKNTFMVIDDEELPLKYIIVPGIPYDLTQSWSYRREA